MFLNKIRNILGVPDTKFVSATNVARAGKRGNICVGNNVSATMCPRLTFRWSVDEFLWRISHSNLPFAKKEEQCFLKLKYVWSCNSFSTKTRYILGLQGCSDNWSILSMTNWQNKLGLGKLIFWLNKPFYQYGGHFGFYCFRYLLWDAQGANTY